MSDNEVAPLETAFGVDHHVSRAEAPERPVQDGGPEMVQLLTPEGERVEHPDYDAVVDALTDEELRGLLPRPGAHPALRRRGHRAAAPGRAGPVGLPARPGGRPGRLRPRAAPDDYVFPTYREHGVAWCRGVDPLNLLGMFRGVNHGGWDPQREELPPLHDRHRRADPARHRLRHGRAARRQRRHRRRRPRHRRHRLLRRRRHQPGRRQRGVHLRRRLQRPGRVLLPEQPVGDLRAHREADPRPALTARRGFGFPGVRVDGNDVLAVSPSPRPRSSRPRRQGPTFIEAFTYRMGAHTTSDDPTKLPRRGRGRGVEAQGPDRAAQGATSTTEGHGRRGRSSTRSSRERRARRLRCASAAWRCPTPPAPAMFDHVYAERAPASSSERAGRVRALPGARSREAH